MNRVPPPCGTRSAYKRHILAREKPCDPCREAERVYGIERRRRAGAIEREALQPCGTEAAYSRHRKRGEVPCEACRAAHRDYNRANYRGRQRRRRP
ncbi:hypothetical protein [Nocardiopsis dassonvillei]|uniref:hypothetical protein n=1 Tax=Nocardiopsis dassonvillei TaxID=2014 RepID=UPI00363ECA08